MSLQSCKFKVLCILAGIRDLKHRQRNARRRLSQPKEDWVEGFVLVVLRTRRVLVLRLVALAMAFKNVRNLLLKITTMALSMMMNLLFCTTSLHRKTSTFRMIRTHNLTWKSSMSPRVLQSFALENEIYEF